MKKDIKNLKSGIVLNVEASNRLFYELKNSNYTYEQCLNELIHNSIASKNDGKLLTITISIFISKIDSSKNYLIFEDDGSGMNHKQLENGISPGKKAGKHKLNDHGLGMNTSIPSLGKLDYLATKTKDINKAIFIEEFKYGKIKTKESIVDFEHGTEICIKNLNPIVFMSQVKYTKYLVKQLGATYRRFLSVNNPKIKLIINFFDIDNNNSLKKSWNIKEENQVFMNPFNRKNMPNEHNILFEGDNWKASLTYGYSAKENDYTLLVMEKPKHYFPYINCRKNQGFDLIINDVILKRNQLTEIGLVDKEHDRFNYIRGEINLIEGFSTTTNKVDVIRNKNFNELVKKIKNYLNEKNYLKPIPYSSKDIKESVYKNRLVKNFNSNRFMLKEEVTPEYTVGALDGHIDILADKEAWELKRGIASGNDMYQLFGYLDMGNIKKGYIVAEGLSSGGKEALKHINNKYDLKIAFVTFKEANIAGDYTLEEIKNFY